MASLLLSDEGNGFFACDAARSSLIPLRLVSLRLTPRVLAVHDGFEAELAGDSAVALVSLQMLKGALTIEDARLTIVVRAPSVPRSSPRDQIEAVFKRVHDSRSSSSNSSSSGIRRLASTIKASLLSSLGKFVSNRITITCKNIVFRVESRLANAAIAVTISIPSITYRRRTVEMKRFSVAVDPFFVPELRNGLSLGAMTIPSRSDSSGDTEIFSLSTLVASHEDDSVATWKVTLGDVGDAARGVASISMRLRPPQIEAGLRFLEACTSHCLAYDDRESCWGANREPRAIWLRAIALVRERVKLRRRREVWARVLRLAEAKAMGGGRGLAAHEALLQRAEIEWMGISPRTNGVVDDASSVSTSSPLNVSVQMIGTSEAILLGEYQSSLGFPTVPSVRFAVDSARFELIRSVDGNVVTTSSINRVTLSSGTARLCGASQFVAASGTTFLVHGERRNEATVSLDDVCVELDPSRAWIEAATFISRDFAFIKSFLPLTPPQSTPPSSTTSSSLPRVSFILKSFLLAGTSTVMPDFHISPENAVVSLRGLRLAIDPEEDSATLTVRHLRCEEERVAGSSDEHPDVYLRYLPEREGTPRTTRSAEVRLRLTRASISLRPRALDELLRVLVTLSPPSPPVAPPSFSLLSDASSTSGELEAEVEVSDVIVHLPSPNVDYAKTAMSSSSVALGKLSLKMHRELIFSDVDSTSGEMEQNEEEDPLVFFDAMSSFEPLAHVLHSTQLSVSTERARLVTSIAGGKPQEFLKLPLLLIEVREARGQGTDVSVRSWNPLRMQWSRIGWDAVAGAIDVMSTWSRPAPPVPLSHRYVPSLKLALAGAEVEVVGSSEPQSHALARLTWGGLEVDVVQTEEGGLGTLATTFTPIRIDCSAPGEVSSVETPSEYTLLSTGTVRAHLTKTITTETSGAEVRGELHLHEGMRLALLGEEVEHRVVKLMGALTPSARPVRPPAASQTTPVMHEELRRLDSRAPRVTLRLHLGRLFSFNRGPFTLEVGSSRPSSSSSSSSSSSFSSDSIFVFGEDGAFFAPGSRIAIRVGMWLRSPSSTTDSEATKTHHIISPPFDFVVSSGEARNEVVLGPARDEAGCECGEDDDDRAANNMKSPWILGLDLDAGVLRALITAARLPSPPPDSPSSSETRKSPVTKNPPPPSRLQLRTSCPLRLRVGLRTWESNPQPLVSLLTELAFSGMRESSPGVVRGDMDVRSSASLDFRILAAGLWSRSTLAHEALLDPVWGRLVVNAPSMEAIPSRGGALPSPPPRLAIRFVTGTRLVLNVSPSLARSLRELGEEIGRISSSSGEEETSLKESPDVGGGNEGNPLTTFVTIRLQNLTGESTWAALSSPMTSGALPSSRGDPPQGWVDLADATGVRYQRRYVRVVSRAMIAWYQDPSPSCAPEGVLDLTDENIALCLDADADSAYERFWNRPRVGDPSGGGPLPGLLIRRKHSKSRHEMRALQLEHFGVRLVRLVSRDLRTKKAIGRGICEAFERRRGLRLPPPAHAWATLNNRRRVFLVLHGACLAYYSGEVCAVEETGRGETAAARMRAIATVTYDELKRAALFLGFIDVTTCAGVARSASHPRSPTLYLDCVSRTQGSDAPHRAHFSLTFDDYATSRAVESALVETVAALRASETTNEARGGEELDKLATDEAHEPPIHVAPDATHVFHLPMTLEETGDEEDGSLGGGVDALARRRLLVFLSLRNDLREGKDQEDDRGASRPALRIHLKDGRFECVGDSRLVAFESSPGTYVVRSPLCIHTSPSLTPSSCEAPIRILLRSFRLLKLAALNVEVDAAANDDEPNRAFRCYGFRVTFTPVRASYATSSEVLRDMAAATMEAAGKATTLGQSESEEGVSTLLETLQSFSVSLRGHTVHSGRTTGGEEEETRATFSWREDRSRPRPASFWNVLKKPVVFEGSSPRFVLLRHHPSKGASWGGNFGIGLGARAVDAMLASGGEAEYEAVVHCICEREAGDEKQLEAEVIPAREFNVPPSIIPPRSGARGGDDKEPREVLMMRVATPRGEGEESAPEDESEGWSPLLQDALEEVTRRRWKARVGRSSREEMVCCVERRRRDNGLVRVRLDWPMAVENLLPIAVVLDGRTNIPPLGRRPLPPLETKSDGGEGGRFADRLATAPRAAEVGNEEEKEDDDDEAARRESLVLRRNRFQTNRSSSFRWGGPATETFATTFPPNLLLDDDVSAEVVVWGAFPTRTPTGDDDEGEEEEEEEMEGEEVNDGEARDEESEGDRPPSPPLVVSLRATHWVCNSTGSVLFLREVSTGRLHRAPPGAVWPLRLASGGERLQMSTRPDGSFSPAFAPVPGNDGVTKIPGGGGSFKVEVRMRTVGRSKTGQVAVPEISIAPYLRIVNRLPSNNGDTSTILVRECVLGRGTGDERRLASGESTVLHPRLANDDEGESRGETGAGATSGDSANGSRIQIRLPNDPYFFFWSEPFEAEALGERLVVWNLGARSDAANERSRNATPWVLCNDKNSLEGGMLPSSSTSPRTTTTTTEADELACRPVYVEVIINSREATTAGTEGEGEEVISLSPAMASGVLISFSRTSRYAGPPTRWVSNRTRNSRCGVVQVFTRAPSSSGMPPPPRPHRVFLSPGETREIVLVPAELDPRATTTCRVVVVHDAGESGALRSVHELKVDWAWEKADFRDSLFRVRLAEEDEEEEREWREGDDSPSVVLRIEDLV